MSVKYLGRTVLVSPTILPWDAKAVCHVGTGYGKATGGFFFTGRQWRSLTFRQSMYKSGHGMHQSMDPASSVDDVNFPPPHLRRYEE